jgi:5'-3' exonuclease
MKKSLLIAIDGSYMEYHSIFRAIRLWSGRNRLEAKSYLTPRIDGTQSNLINSDTFKSELYNSFLHTCYVIPEIIESNFGQYRGFDIRGYATIVFCADDFTSHGFRKQIYEDYKGKRTESRAKNPYDLYKIKKYFKILFDQTDVWNRCGFKYAFVDGAEGDDIIYTLMTTYGKNYDNRVVIASDKDLLQIPDTLQFDLNDKIVKREGKYGPISAQDFLIRKILIGDASDNIPQVFNRVGPAKAEKIIREGRLKDMFIKHPGSAEQFELNMKLMDMSQMPEDLHQRIETSLAEVLKNESEETFSLDEEIENMLGDPIQL